MNKAVHTNQDQIIYTAGKRADFDKKALQTNIALDEHYDTHHNMPPEIKPEVINPSEVLGKIKARLTPIELAVVKVWGLK